MLANAITFNTHDDLRNDSIPVWQDNNSSENVEFCWAYFTSRQQTEDHSGRAV
jgi:hypothetical protein